MACSGCAQHCNSNAWLWDDIGSYPDARQRAAAGVEAQVLHITDSWHTGRLAQRDGLLSLSSPRMIGLGCGTSRTSAPAAASCTWQQCWTCIHAKSLVGPWSLKCQQRWCARPYRWLSPNAIQPRVFLCIPTGKCKAYSTSRRNAGRWPDFRYSFRTSASVFQSSILRGLAIGS